jgi:hypothetical protein
MKWEQVFDLPCGCKRVPKKGRKNSVLVQRWEDICPTHQAEHTQPGEETAVQKQMREEIKIQETIREMAVERINARKKV